MDERKRKVLNVKKTQLFCRKTQEAQLNTAEIQRLHGKPLNTERDYMAVRVVETGSRTVWSRPLGATMLSKSKADAPADTQLR